MATKFYLRNSDTSGAATGSDAMHDLQTARGSAVVTYTKNTVAGPVTPPTVATQFTATAGGTVVTFASSQLNAVTISGAITINLWAKESATAANATITAAVLRLDATGVVVSTIAAVVLNRTELTTSLAAQSISPTVTTTTLAQGDRIGVRVYIDDGSGSTMSSGRTVTMTLDGASASASGDSWIQFTETISSAPQTLAATGITSEESFGVASLSEVLSAVGLVSGEAFGVSSVQILIYASGIASSEAVGTDSLTQVLKGLGVSSSESFGIASVSTSSGSALSAIGIGSTESFGVAKLSFRLLASGIVSIETFGSSRLKLSLVATGIPSDEHIGANKLSQIVHATGINSGETFGANRLLLGLHGVGVASSSSVGVAALSQILQAIGISSGEAIGNALLAQRLNLIAFGVASSVVFGAAKVAHVLKAHGFSKETFGIAVVTGGSTQNWCPVWPRPYLHPASHLLGDRYTWLHPPSHLEKCEDGDD